MIAALLLSSLTLPAAVAAHAPPTPPDARTAEAVIAVDDAWGEAETGGDHAFLAWLLEDGYRSISASGKTTTRAQLVDGARTRGPSPERARLVADWKARHPSHADVHLAGDTAILTWVSDEADSRGRVNSSDIFVYRDGHWHAVFSQHAAIDGAH